MENNVKVQDETQSLQSCVSVSVTDLRIGNYVIYNNKEIGTITGVQAFLFNNGKVAINQRLDIFYHTENIKPIPLTEEWLLKLGFVSNPYQDRYDKGIFHIECDKTKGETILWLAGVPHIKYIHQLQNLYHALNGCDLQIGNLTEH